MYSSTATGRLIRPFVEEPLSAGLFTDFDGTLAAIVDRPPSAVPVKGAMDALVAVAAKLATVWVVSGRPVSFLEPFLPRGINLSGLYGLESVSGGVRSEHPDADRWRAVIDAVSDRALVELPWLGVERKGLALTLHYRREGSSSADAVRALAEECAADTGLVVHDARMSVELRPPIRADKGMVLEEAADGLAAACFVGDDRGDLTAFDALDRLAATGVSTLRVGVHSAEAPPELLDRADLVVAGPHAVVELLRSLA